MLARVFAAPGARRLIPGPARDRALRILADRLARSPGPECRAVAAVALLSTAGRRPNLRAEKIVSHRRRYLWLCIPKAASRSIIAALGAADPAAELIRGRTLEEVLAAARQTR